MKIGTFCIINDFDRPYARNIAMVTGQETTEKGIIIYRAKYLYSNDKRHHECKGVKPTPVSDFGVRVHIDFGAGSFYTVPDSETVQATYCDGTPRAWDGRHRESFELDPMVERIYRALETVEEQQ